MDILGMAKVRRPKAGKVKLEGYTWIYSGNSNAHVNGVGIIMTDEVASTIAAYYAGSERVIGVKLLFKPFNCNIIRLFALTSTSTAEENFYDNVEEAYRQCKPREMTIVMGDLNAKVRHRSNDADERNVLGPFGLGNRNEGEEVWIEWCLAKQQIQGSRYSFSGQ